MTLSFSRAANRAPHARGAGVTAVLGPTNTGKTYLAIERMLGHSSGILGVPLRLLAREIYNKIVDRLGADAVALVTGEEKIKPPSPRYWVATVEAMPQDLDVAFLAIDEVQLGADLERGHVFTDRMLNRRGREETLVLGAQTVRPMVERLLPGAHILSRPRLSQLTHAGDRKITRLPRRTAIVAFSADEVYAIAELIRRQRGGAAVILGALSPRTRNAQVALYQAGDVDYLVATDAIGMGLNLDVDHVAFASDRKFDGYQYRRLNPAELAQIAGRAGRATRDGTFGTTGRCEPFEPELVQALESHSFEPIKVLQWRNTRLDFGSLGALQAALATTPAEATLTRAPVAEDIRVLEHAVRDDDVRAFAKSPRAVELLWDICQVPDYRKISPATHAELVITLYGFLMREGRLPTDWFERQVAQADRTDGDIDTLSTRIAHIRTWTFAANRPDWLDDPEHWQGVTRGIEDRLSDALHERLLHRFVDRRTSVLMRRLRENAMLETEVTKTGEVLVEGHVLGRLEGFRFVADPTAGGSEAKALRSAAQKALAGEIDQRAGRLAGASDDHFVLASDGTIRWLGDAVGKLAAGEEVLHPQVRVIADEHLTGAPRDSVQARLDLWLKAHIERLLGPLGALARAEDITGLARGIAFQLVETLGVLERHKVADDVKSLDQEARARLRKYGVRFGAYHIYLPALLKPAPRVLAMQLWAVKQASPDTKGLDELPQLAASGRTSFPVDKEVPKSLYRTIGYRVCGERALRVDILERLADLIRPALAWRPGVAAAKPPGAVDGAGFAVTGAMTSLAGSSGEDFASILRSLGYRMERRPKPADPAAENAAPREAPAPRDGSPEALGTPGSPDLTSAAADRPAEGADKPTPVAEAAAAPTDEIEIAMAAIAASLQAATGTAVSADGGADGEATSADPAPSDATVPDPAPTQAGAADPTPETGAEEALIEVWRPGRREDRGAPRDRTRARRGEHGRSAAPRVAEPAASPAPEVYAGAAAPEGDAPLAARGDAAGQRGRPHRKRRDDDERMREDRRADDRRRAGRPRRDRPEDDHGGREDYHGRPRRERADAAPRSFGGPRERREKMPDPDSPFAKLAALKEQLEANAKERR
jgi:ATP-dependent RNA helicase SUPV3L1/SUV3